MLRITRGREGGRNEEESVDTDVDADVDADECEALALNSAGQDSIEKLFWLVDWFIDFVLWGMVILRVAALLALLCVCDSMNAALKFVNVVGVTDGLCVGLRMFPGAVRLSCA